MRIRYSVLGIFLAVAPSAYSLELRPPVLSPLQQQEQAANLSAQLLTEFAYKPVPLDDVLSEKIMTRFIESLDPDRIFFLKADIDTFMADSAKIDDAILQKDLELPFAVFNTYSQRAVDRIAYARALLKQNFSFDVQENYSLARDTEPWPQSEPEVEDLWRKRVKSDWLRLKLAGQADAEIRVTLDKRYKAVLDRVYKYKSDDVFQSFMAAYTTSVDPHTDYFGAAASADFDISMKLSLVGIGAVLQERDGYTTIRELVPGGPAQLSGKLTVGDRIIGVGQGDDGSVKDVVGNRLDEVVQLIRGETARKIGVIALPAFYEDFDARRKGEKDYRSASRDVAALLGELKAEDVDGVLMDLRDNGGGSLDEAIDLTGLFVGKGPVVQQRNAKGKVRIESDDLSKPAWSGPVGVLINRGSASASEIFAAAIQDYGRGVIVGEPSFGKGTVQTVVDLDEVARNSKPKFGQLKLTIAQFFRIDGGTTQLRGVTPDIALPGLSDPKTLGEASYNNALPWDKIKPAKYAVVGHRDELLPQLQSRHKARVTSDPDYQRFEEDVAALKAQRDKTSISLNEKERRNELAALADRLKNRPQTNGAFIGGEDDGLQANERSLGADIALEKTREQAKDVLKNEAAAIVADEAELQGRLKAAVR
jgi:carboxyl-terminal processing protease